MDRMMLISIMAAILLAGDKVAGDPASGVSIFNAVYLGQQIVKRVMIAEEE